MINFSFSFNYILRCLLLIAIIPGIESIGYSQISRSLEDLEKELPLSRDTMRVRMLVDLSSGYKRSDVEKSLSYANQALAEANFQGYDRGRFLAWYSMAAAFFYQGNYLATDSLSNLAMDLMQVWAKPYEQAQLLNLKGLSLLNRSRYAEALQPFRQALQLYNQVGDASGMAKATSNLGVIYFYWSDFTRSIQYYTEALRMAEKAGDRYMQAEALSNMGMSYTSIKDYKRALEFHRRAFKHFETLQDNRGLARTLNSLGTAWFNQDQLDSAGFYYQKALPLFKAIGDISGEATVLNNQAEALLLQGQATRALDLFKTVAAMRQKSGESYGLAIALANQAKAHELLRNPKRSAELFDSAFALASVFQSDWLTCELLLARHKFYQNQKQYEKSLQDLIEWVNVNNILFNKDKVQMIEEIAQAFEAEKREKELLAKDLEMAQLAQERNQSRMLLIVLSALMVLFIAALWLFFRRRQQARKIMALRLEADKQLAEAEKEKAQLQKKALEAELHFKRQELTQMALYISKQNEWMEAINHDLKPNDPESVRQVQRSFSQMLSQNLQREQFEQNIELINKEFYRQLRIQFPDLTDYDLKLCAMARLKLSTKEMAAVLNISVKSADMARYRLRKKLQLAPDVDLGRFLEQVEQPV